MTDNDRTADYRQARIDAEIEHELKLTECKATANVVGLRIEWGEVDDVTAFSCSHEIDQFASASLMVVRVGDRVVFEVTADGEVISDDPAKWGRWLTVQLASGSVKFG